MSKQDNHGIAIRLDIPPDHHPTVIQGDSPGAVTGRGALTAIYDAIGKINDTAARVKDKGRLASAAQPFAERAVQSVGRAMETLKKQVEHLDSQIDTAISPPVDPTLAGQIRTYWANSGSKALPGLRKAIEEGDAATISAVLHTPAYLSGLSDENQELLRQIATKRYAPDKTVQRAEAADALQRVERATNFFMETIAGNLRKWRDDDAKIIQEGLQR